MPVNDPYTQYAVTPPPVMNTGASDPYAQYAVGGGTVAPVNQPAPIPQTNPEDPYAQYSTSAPSAAPQPPQSPENGQPTSSPDAPWYEKAWDWANTPLIDLHRNGATGVESGLEHVVSGFTSPLSIALTLGTFGTAGFIESAGANILKEAGLAAPEIADVAKSAQVASKAMKAGQNIEEAVTQAGLDYNKYKNAINTLYDAGVTEHDLIGGNLADRGIAALSRKLGMGAAQSANVAKGVQALVSTGFTAEAAKSAVEMSPRVLDAMKDGDYEKASELATEAAASGLFGGLGAVHALKSYGELRTPLEAKLRPTDESLAVKKEFDVRDREHQEAAQAARLFADDMYKQLGHKNPHSPFTSQETIDSQVGQLGKIYHAISLGFDKDLAAQHFNALAEAAGREERLPTEDYVEPSDYRYKALDTTKPVSGRFYHGSKAAISSASELDPGSHANEQSLYGIGAYFTDNPRVAEGYAKTRGRGAAGKIFAADIKNANLLDLEKSAPDEIRQVFSKVIKGISGEEPDFGESTTGKDLFRSLQEAMVSEGYPRSEAQDVLSDLTTAIREKGYDGLRHQGGDLVKGNQGEHNVAIIFPDYGVGRPLTDIVNDGGIHPPSRTTRPELPENLRELIENSKLKEKPKEYIDRLLDSYKGVYKGLDDVETQVAKSIRERLNKGLEQAVTDGMLKEGIEDYVTRRWKKPTEDGKLAAQEAAQGRFDTNVSMARKRVFEDELTPLLKGWEYASEDPVGLTSDWLSQMGRATANRKFIQRILDTGRRGSDSRPAVVMSGVARSAGGDNPATMITPERVRKINIAKPEVASLRESGDLQRFLDDGTIQDLTPRANKRNLDDLIDRLENRAVKSPITFDENGNVELRKQIDLLKDVRDGKRPISDLDEFNAAQKPVYVWNPQGYVRIDSPALRKWNFIAGDSVDNPLIMESQIAVHPEYAQYFKNRLGLDESGLKNLKPVLKAGSGAKKLLLSLSPFHMNQEALRAVMLGISPFMKAAPTFEESPALRLVAEKGGTFEPDPKAMANFSEGLSEHSGLVSKIPGVGKFISKSLTSYEDFLFKKYIPNLKARAAVDLFEKYQKKYPDWSREKVAEATAKHVNDTFGGQNWRALGRSTTTQDWARLLFLAPDWLESEVRSAARLFNMDEGAIGRAQMARFAMYLWGAARVLNMVTTGKPHFEAPFGVAIKNDQGKETVYSMRTMPTDILHAVSDPVGFLKGRVSPVMRAANEVYTSRDQYGRKLAPGDLAVDLVHNIAPLPLQALGKMQSSGTQDLSNTDQVVKALGGTAMVYKTEAQKKAAELASNHTENGPLDTSQLHRHQRLMQFEDQLRTGKMPMSDLTHLVMSGQLPQSDAKKIVENIKQTRNLTPDQASLYTRAARLPAKELLDVFDIATPSERQALTPLIVKARRSYMKKALTSMTPEERMADPTLRKLNQLFPQALPPL